MKGIVCWIAALAFAGTGLPALADHDKDESGHGHYKHERRHKGGEYKEEYWDGNCKIERKWEKNGKFKEERKCEGPRQYGGYPPPVYREPGVVVTPPAVVIQPPPIVIR